MSENGPMPEEGLQGEGPLPLALSRSSGIAKNIPRDAISALSGSRLQITLLGNDPEIQCATS